MGWSTCGKFSLGGKLTDGYAKKWKSMALLITKLLCMDT
uniref:Uncharacterized protein n=1 Tax=Rhizophora mucronata TaxID=61149 RepID=A0A2P2K0W2_RHIMU